MRRKIHKVVKGRSLAIFIRLGYLIRGILYGSMGLVALTVAVGISKNAVNTNGVIEMISNLYFGKYLLIIVIAGLSGYSTWGFARAFIDILDKRKEGIHFFNRIGYLISAVSYALLIIPTILLILDLKNPANISLVNELLVRIIHIPYGNILIAIIGVCAIFGGLNQVKLAVKAKKPMDFRSTETRKKYGVPFMIFARIGISARGIIFILIGYVIVVSGFQYNIEALKEIDNVLNIFLDMYGGSFALFFLGAGLIFFGIYSALLSLWVDLS